MPTTGRSPVAFNAGIILTSEKTVTETIVVQNEVGSLYRCPSYIIYL